MKLQITGKHIDLGEPLQVHCQEAIKKIRDKYQIDPTSATVLFLKKEHHQFEVDISLHLERGVYIRVCFQDHDIYQCFNEALSKIQEKIVKHKKRIDDHHKHHDNHTYKKLSAMDATLDATWFGIEGTKPPSIITSKIRDIPALSVSEAAMRLELQEAVFLVFRNKDHGRVNFLCRLPDGHITWIDPQESL
jgi:ribosomal subunit interface protein